MAYFSNPVLNAAALGPIPVCILSAYRDVEDLVMTVLADGPTAADAQRLAEEHGVKLFKEDGRWYLAPLDWP